MIMKKTALMIFCIIMIIIFASCNVNTEYTETLSRTQNILNYESSTDTDDIQNTHKELETECPNVDEPIPTYSTLEAYNIFITKAKLPSDFIYYEMLKSIGEFDSLVILTTDSGDYSRGMYSFIDNVGNRIYLYFEPYEEVSNSKAISKIQNAEDLRCIDKKDSGVYIHKDLTYRYVNGSLISIEWKYENQLLSLCFEKKIQNCSLKDLNPFIRNMLNNETAALAVSDLAKGIEQIRSEK